MRVMKATALGALMAGVFALPPPAMAQAAERPAVTHVQTVTDLAAVCDPAWQGVPRLEAIAYCQGFLTSFGQHHQLLHPAGGAVRPLFCVPVPGPTVAESGIGFAAWARANPQHHGEAALDGLLRWAQSNFPCPPSQPRSRTSRSAR